MAISAEQICNLALSRLGNYGSIENIASPSKPTEYVFAKWWNVCKQMALQEVAPNFALHRDNIASDAVAPAFGYSYRYRKPADCLRVLGFGEISTKQNVYSIEGEWILTDEYSGEALPLRYVRDIDDVTKFTPETVSALSFFLAYYGNMEITQDPQKQQLLETMLPTKKAEMAAINGIENKPIRISRSKFNAARNVDDPVFYQKY